VHLTTLIEACASGRVRVTYLKRGGKASAVDQHHTGKAELGTSHLLLRILRGQRPSHCTRWRRRGRPFADLNLRVVHMRQHLVEIAHVEIRSADRAIAEMIGLGFGDAIRIETGIARDHKSSLMPLKNG
jgi:hypothetical protein